MDLIGWFEWMTMIDWLVELPLVGGGVGGRYVALCDKYWFFFWWVGVSTAWIVGKQGNTVIASGIRDKGWRYPVSGLVGRLEERVVCEHDDGGGWVGGSSECFESKEGARPTRSAEIYILNHEELKNIPWAFSTW